MNELSHEFIMSLSSKPMTFEEAFAMFGGKYEYYNQCTRHFNDLIETTADREQLILTLSGRDYVESQKALCKRQQEQEEQRQADEAKAVRNRKQQFRHDWRVGIVSLLVGAALTLILEHIEVIFSFLREMVTH